VGGADTQALAALAEATGIMLSSGGRPSQRQAGDGDAGEAGGALLPANTCSESPAPSDVAQVSAQVTVAAPMIMIPTVTSRWRSAGGFGGEPLAEALALPHHAVPSGTTTAAKNEAGPGPRAGMGASHGRGVAFQVAATTASSDSESESGPTMRPAKLRRTQIEA
jgi:hypothetical protein